jgi:hypothetical protein
LTGHNRTPGASLLGAGTGLDVTINDRAHEAHRMHMAGADWPTIASTLGYASAKSASMAVTAHLQKAGLEHGVEQRRDALLFELDRLDALQVAVWDKAVGGDLKAAAFVVGLMERRVKLLGLDRVGLNKSEPSGLVLDS